VTVHGSASWGNHVTAIGTFLKNASAGLYNLYVVDKSQQQVLSYSPRADGGGYPIPPNKWLDATRSVDNVTSLYIDGDVYMADDGKLARYVSGNGDGWKSKDPGDDMIRAAPRYTLLASGSDRREGQLYAFDQANARIIAFNKSDGSYIEQYRLNGGDAALQGLRGLFVVPGADEKPATLYWISADVLHVATLAAAPAPAASPSPGASGAASPDVSVTASPKP
jgi:outer membrane protein assembly factor BamB